jgi:hypothetical protein
VKSFSPAGAATKAYFGLGARTFGNPDGATRGGGAYAAGGANLNGPNQGGGPGGGGGTVTFSILAAPNSNGPYQCLPGPGSSAEFSADSASLGSVCGTTTGAIVGDPVSVNGAALLTAGQVKGGGPHYNTVCLAGDLPQNHFINWTFDDGAGNTYDLTSASAGFSTPWDDTGSGGTIWTWLVPPGQEFAPLNQPMVNGVPAFAAAPASGGTLTGRLVYASPAGASNNVAPGGTFPANISRLIVTLALGDANWTGLAAGSDGQLLFLTNGHAANSLTLNASNAGSLAANQFLYQFNVILGPGISKLLCYDATLAKWLIA